MSKRIDVNMDFNGRSFLLCYVVENDDGQLYIDDCDEVPDDINLSDNDKDLVFSTVSETLNGIGYDSLVEGNVYDMFITC
jgi:hypothetical protein